MFQRSIPETFSERFNISGPFPEHSKSAFPEHSRRESGFQEHSRSIPRSIPRAFPEHVLGISLKNSIPGASPEHFKSGYCQPSRDIPGAPPLKSQHSRSIAEALPLRYQHSTSISLEYIHKPKFEK